MFFCGEEGSKLMQMYGEFGGISGFLLIICVVWVGVI